MLQLRLSRIEKLLQIAYRPLTKYEESAVCTVVRHENLREICDAMILGVLIAKLRECGLYPRKQNIDCDHFSVNNLMGKVRDIFAFGLSNESIPGVENLIVGDHSDCGVDLDHAVDILPPTFSIRIKILIASTCEPSERSSAASAASRSVNGLLMTRIE